MNDTIISNFLIAIVECGTIKGALVKSGMRQSEFNILKEIDASFREQVDDQLAFSVGMKEIVLSDRAEKGLKRNVYHKGELVDEEYIPDHRSTMAFLEVQDRERYTPGINVKQEGEITFNLREF